MSELILEIYSEEIPARMQIAAGEQLKKLVEEGIREEGLAYKTIEFYVTPHRLSLHIDGLPAKQKDTEEEKRGPRVDAPEKAVEGFLKGAGLASVKELEKRKTEKGEFYFAVIKKKGQNVAKVLQAIIEASLQKFSWPKSMKWGKYDIRWVRPLHHIMCVFNKKIVPVNFGHITASNITKGHRFMAPKSFEVVDFKHYQEQLEKQYVMLDHRTRQASILAQAEAIANKQKLEIKQDAKLLEEVTGLVEWPVVLPGNIDKKFLTLPEEALISVMRTHQKYFALYTAKGKLAPYFIITANMLCKDKGAQIISGNERVLRARFEDAMFFWDQDRRHLYETHVAALKKITFHAKLGTLEEKNKRVVDLAKLYAIWIPHADLIKVERAALLSKADLVTEMVGEFPELQGIMGGYYAAESGEDSVVAEAVRDHYKPVGASDDAPKDPVTIAVALADKIDSLVGMFAIGEKPTGTKDPFALRRAALGVIRIILENNLRIPLKLLFEKAILKYPNKIFKGEEEQKRALIFKRRMKGVKGKKETLMEELLSFFIDRLKVILKGQNIRHDLIEAIFSSDSEDDLTRLVARVRALEAFISSDDGINLIATYRRAANIVEAEEKKDDECYEGNVDTKLLKEKEEVALNEMCNSTQKILTKYLKEDQFDKAMQEIANMRGTLDAFFDKVVVNDKDSATRKNRLALLSNLRGQLDKVANFGEVEL